LNEVIVHGLPSERVLKEGDIISLDLGIFYKGFHTDMAITLGVGKISKEAEKLIKTTKKALEIGIEKVKIGNNFGDLGKTIQDFVESQGFNVVRELCGHGIGRNLHEDPKVLNYYDKETANLEIKEGMVFCLEPMITLGDWRLEKSADGHGFKTKDNSLSAHFEHTLAVTKKGCLVLTALDDF
jgi:methionyl aminopeptidase